MTHGEFETIEVERHSLFYRVCHWGIVSTGIVMGLTGLRLGSLYGFTFPKDMELALHIHLYLGFVFGALWIALFAYVVAHEWKWFSPKRFPYAMKFFIAEARAWTGLGPHVEDPRRYNPDKGEYIEKLVPTEVMVLWMYLGLALLMGITGFSLYYTDIFAPVIEFSDRIAPMLGVSDGDTLLRAIHRLGMYIFLMVMLIHAYAVIIFDVLGSMITGKRKERVARE